MHGSRAVAGGLEQQLVASAGDEHGILKPAEGNQRVPRLDEVIWLIPGHCDPTVNLHNHLVGVAGGLVNGRIDKIIRVDARGALT